MKFAYRWHGRLGLVLAPLLAVSALSGACLLWLQPLPMPAQMQTPGSITGWAQALDRGLAELARQQPGTDADLVDLPRQAGDPIRVHLRSADPDRTGLALVDADDGRAGALRPDHLDPRTHLLHLHEHLLHEGLGPWVLRAVALVAIVGVGLGLRIAWRLRKLPARSPWRRWHRRVGFVAATPILLMLITGFVLRSPELACTVLAAADGSAAAAVPVALPTQPNAPATPAASLGQVLSAAHAAMPDARPMRLYAARDGVVRVRLRGDDWNPYGMNNVYVRASDAAVLRAVRRQDLPLEARYLDVVYPLHSGWLPGDPGRAAGLALRLLWTGVALALAWMAVSGAWSRLRGRPALTKSGQK